MAIDTVDALIAALPGQQLPFIKGPSAAMQAVGQYYSPWLLAGIPGAGVTPSSGVNGVAVSDSDAGGFAFTNPASGLTYLAKLTHYPNVAGILLLYDRLWHNSGLSPTVLTAQAITPAALPSRCPVASDPTGETFDALGNQVEAWMQVMGTAMGAGATGPSISYTNSAGTSGRTGTVMGFAATAAIGRAFPFSMAAGDRGVRSVQSWTNGATMTSGVFSLVLRRRLASIMINSANFGEILDWAEVSLAAIPNDAHLEFLWVPQTTTAVTLQGELILAQG